MCSSGRCARCLATPALGSPGRNAAAGAIPTITVQATLLAPGSVPVGDPLPVTQSGSILAPVFNIGIPAPEPGEDGIDGDDAIGIQGEDGIPCFTQLLNTFTMPAIGFTEVITVADSSAFANQSWAYITGAGYVRIVANPPSATTLLIRNPGVPDGFASGVTGNAAGGASITSNGLEAQVVVAGRPAGDPEPGPAGDAPVIVIAYTAPTDPPDDPTEGFVFVADAAPPARATSFVPYAWDGAAWVAGPNIAGVAGAKAFFGTTDPNTVDPSGSVVGDYMFRYQAANFTLFEKTGVSIWTNRGSIPWPGSVTQTVDITVAGTYAIPLEYFSYNIRTIKDVTFNWDDTNYGDQGVWTVCVENVDGASNVHIDFTGGRWEKSPDTAYISSLPVTLTPGDIMVFTFVKNVSNGLYIVTNAFAPAAL